MLEIPERIGPYRVLSKVGEGGMGVVYKAEDSRLERVVALKVIREFEGDSSRRSRFWQEARRSAGGSSECVPHRRHCRRTGPPRPGDGVHRGGIAGAAHRARFPACARGRPDRAGAALRALDMLSRAIDNGFFCHQAMVHDPWLDALRGRPKFAELLRKAHQLHAEALTT